MKKSLVAGLEHALLVLGQGGVTVVDHDLSSVDPAVGVAPVGEGLGGVDELGVEPG